MLITFCDPAICIKEPWFAFAQHGLANPQKALQQPSIPTNGMQKAMMTNLLLLMKRAGMWFLMNLLEFLQLFYLNRVLELLLEVMGNVVAVGNVPDARQRHTGREGLCKAWQPMYTNRV